MQEPEGSARRAYVAGVLCANALPHLATAIAGRRHLTPLAGRDSSAGVNLAWAVANAVGGGALLRSATREPTERRDRRLVTFEAGALTMAAWMLASEHLGQVNHTR